MLPTDSRPTPDLSAFFGVDDALLARVLAEAMSRGADFADLYFEHATSHSVMLEDGIISRASSSVDQGVGIRAVVGDQTGYAYSEDLSLDAMLRAARTAASIAAGGGSTAPTGLPLSSRSTSTSAGLYQCSEPSPSSR